MRNHIKTIRIHIIPIIIRFFCLLPALLLPQPLLLLLSMVLLHTLHLISLSLLFMLISMVSVMTTVVLTLLRRSREMDTQLLVTTE